MPYELISFPGDAELARTAAADWLAVLQKRAADKITAPYSVALSGGRITKTFFGEIVKQAPAVGNPVQLFQGVHFFWADERCVPPSDPESNFAIAKNLLFDPLKIPLAQIHRLRGEGVEAEALADAIKEITSLTQVINGQPVLDLIFLGMGEDGHTASLFPGENQAVIENPAIYRAVTAVKPPPRRFTLGFSAIAAAKDVWALVSGAGKEVSLRETLSPGGKTPMGRILQLRKHTKILTDVKPA